MPQHRAAPIAASGGLPCDGCADVARRDLPMPELIA